MAKSISPGLSHIDHTMKKFLHLIKQSFGVPLIWIYLRLVQVSSKMTVRGEDFADKMMHSKKGHIFVFWHNRQFILPLLRLHDTVHCLISESRDGDSMSTLIRYFGKRSIRGSSSRNGLRAMRELMLLLDAGAAIGIATDGPRGPAFQVKPGVVQMAQSKQLPIIPVSFDATKKKVLRSWDSSYLLYPFGRIAVVYGAPIWVDHEQSVEAACELVRVGLNQAGEAASNILSSKS